MDFITWIRERLCAHEGGAGTIHIGYDDATFHYVITQTKFDEFRTNELLGSARSLERAVQLAISGRKYDE